MRYPNFRNGTRVVFSTRELCGPLWPMPQASNAAPLPKTWDVSPQNPIVQCRKSHRPGCMADTTGPMPLIRCRGEGKRRLGLGFTSLWTIGQPFELGQSCVASGVWVGPQAQRHWGSKPPLRVPRAAPGCRCGGEAMRRQSWAGPGRTWTGLASRWPPWRHRTPPAPIARLGRRSLQRHRERGAVIAQGVWMVATQRVRIRLRRAPS